MMSFHYPKVGNFNLFNKAFSLFQGHCPELHQPQGGVQSSGFPE